MKKILLTSVLAAQFFLGAFSTQLFAQTPNCPTEPFEAGIIWANRSNCRVQNVQPAEYSGEPIQYVWIASSANSGNCETSMPELLDFNVGDLYDEFLAEGGFNGGASPVIASTSWSFVTDGDNDDLTLMLTEVDDATCYSRCARVVGCTNFYGEAASTLRSCSAILPVELTRFDGTADGCNIQLSWSSASEENFSHYELERSNDGRTFELAESIRGSGSTQGGHYFLNDNNAGIDNYYRLKMIDYDLTHEYSKIIQVNADCDIVEKIIAFPNPVADDFINIKVEAKRAAEELVKLVDITGQEVFTQNLSLKEGINTFRLDVSELPARIYFIKVGKRVHSRIVKTSDR